MLLDNKTLTYSGAPLSLGANTLTMSGGGTFYNSDNLTLSAESILKLDGIGRVEKVYVSENLTNGFIDVNENTTIQTFSQTKSSRIDIAEWKEFDAGQILLKFLQTRQWNFMVPEVELSILATT